MGVYFCRLKINHDSHQFILESGTVANNNAAVFYSKQVQIYCSRIVLQCFGYIAAGLYSTGADILQESSTPRVQIYCSRVIFHTTQVQIYCSRATFHRCCYIASGFCSRGVDLLQKGYTPQVQIYCSPVILQR
jgi:hypothetical protein